LAAVPAVRLWRCVSGGASLAHKLAPTGKRILLIERGDYLPRSQANWSSKAVFVDAIY